MIPRYHHRDVTV